MGGPHTQEKLADMKMDQQESAPKTTNEVGRPEGTGTPQTTKNVSPIGQGSINFSLSCVTENVNLANKLVKSVESQLRIEHGIKRLNKKQKEVAESIAELIVVNEEPKDWTKKVKAYVKKPVDQNLERVEKVQEIAVEHQVNTYLAGILYASKK